MAEIIDIGISKLDDEPIRLDISNPSPTPSQKSVNFGPGLDMLMNNKKKNTSNSSSKSINDGDEINIDDLNKLESELNDLSEHETPKSTTKNIFSKPFISLNTEHDDKSETIKPTPIKLNSVDNISDSDNKPLYNLGKSPGVANNIDNSETWDGYKNFNEIPIDPTINVEEKPKPMSHNEILRKKKEYINKLKILKKKGADVSKEYNMSDPLDEIQGEYEFIKRVKLTI